MNTKQTSRPSDKHPSQPSADAVYSLAIKLFNAGNYGEVLPLYSKLHNRDPNNFEALNFLGIIAQKAGQHQFAIKSFSQALTINNQQASVFHNLGISHYQLGDHKEAVANLKVALQIEPGNSQISQDLQNFQSNQKAKSPNPGELQKALINGFSAQKNGQLDDAAHWYGQALEIAPNNTDAINNLGLVLSAKGKIDEAITVFKRAIKITPENPGLYNNIGNAYKAIGELEQAISYFKQSLSIKPDSYEAHCNIGATLKAQGKLNDAVDHYQKALLLRQDIPEVYNNLGNTLTDQGRLDEAVSCLKKAIAIKPDYIEAHNNLGVVLTKQGKLDAALECYKKTLSINPHNAESHRNLGYTLKEQGHLDAAIECFHKALAINPDNANTNNDLGNALAEQGKTSMAVSCYKQALSIKPDYAEALSNLGNALTEQGKFDEAIVFMQKAVEIKKDYTEAHSNLLMNMHYSPDCSAQEIYDEHIKWDKQHAEGLLKKTESYRNSIAPERKIRIGMVSGSFRRHPVGYMIVTALENLDGQNFELYGYSNTLKMDDLGQRIRESCLMWRLIAGMNDQEVCALIKEDAIDILVDLSGHASNNRLLVFARKPAPVQVKWVGGQFNTTGMQAMDYYISDWVESPQDHDRWYTEQVVRLPDGYVCYAPPNYAPAVNTLPMLSNNHVTFGCFNNLAKINSEVIVLWAKLLRKMQGSKLILISKQLGDADTQERYKKSFMQEGILPEQLDLRGVRPHSELLKSYNEIDIALDPFPYSGGLTTCESLWMGVPVVTMPGPTFAGRHSATHLSNVGLNNWVTNSPNEYLDVVEKWCDNAESLANLRSNLREQVARSPLCDAPRFARNLETMFREMWQKWREKPKK
jgi:protein O-GlcNAc transferase